MIATRPVSFNPGRDPSYMEGWCVHLSCMVDSREVWRGKLPAACVTDSKCNKDPLQARSDRWLREIRM